jgi:hypothetical protein
VLGGAGLGVTVTPGHFSSTVFRLLAIHMAVGKNKETEAVS